MPCSRVCLAAVVTLAAVLAAAPDSPLSPRYRGWRTYGGSPDQIRYSSLRQIDRTNVARLERAWSYDTGETGGLQTQPIVVDGVLYGCTPTQKTFALRADTGEHLWTFDSGLTGRGPNRGVMYWEDGDDKRIFTAADEYLYALDARTGRPMPTFGDNGRIDLRRDLGNVTGDGRLDRHDDAFLARGLKGILQKIALGSRDAMRHAPNFPE